MGNPSCMVTLSIREQRKTHVETPGSPVSEFEGNILNFDSGLEISTEIAPSMISFLLSSGHQGQLYRVVNLQPHGSFWGSFPGPSMFLGFASSLCQSRWAQEVRPSFTLAWAYSCRFHCTPTHFCHVESALSLNVQLKSHLLLEAVLPLGAPTAPYVPLSLLTVFRVPNKNRRVAAVVTLI